MGRSSPIMGCNEGTGKRLLLSCVRTMGHTVAQGYAGYLHDTIEDTTRSFKDISERFGEQVAELVYCVTSELGRNRSERNKKTYPKIAANRQAVVLKLADRIANVEYGLATGGKQDMYAKEFPDFFAGLKGDEANIQREINMWNHLRRLLGV